MGNRDILSRLNLGNPVAEMDHHLTDLFISTNALSEFVDDRFDIVLGVKGSGKSALLRVVQSRQKEFEQLKDVYVKVATEHTGEPSFKRAFGELSAGAYSLKDLVSAWKTYLLNIALDAIEEIGAAGLGIEAIKLATRQGIRYKTTSMYKKVFWCLLRFVNIRSFSVGADRIHAEFGDAPPEVFLEQKQTPDFPEIFSLCSRAFEEQGLRCWVLIDRLDAAFQDDPELEKLALKALLLAYRDFQGSRSLCPKLFFRNDLFDLVTEGEGFRELSHVQARTSLPIVWDRDSLLSMLMNRFVFNESIRERYGVDREAINDSEVREALCFSIFTDKVDNGEKKADTWTWIMNRIVDANGTRTPRDLQTLVLRAVSTQLEILARDGDEQTPNLLSPTAIKEGLSQLSQEKLHTTLLAEYPNLRPALLAFRKNKAEHDATSLQQLLGDDWESIVESLNRIGFIEVFKDSSSWKIPMIYRDGLEVTQGSTFDKNVTK